MPKFDSIAQQVLKGIQNAILLKRAGEEEAAQQELQRAQLQAKLIGLAHEAEQLKMQKERLDAQKKLWEGQLKLQELQARKPMVLGQGWVYFPERGTVQQLPQPTTETMTPLEQARTQYWQSRAELTELERRARRNQAFFNLAARQRVNEILERIRKENRAPTAAEMLELSRYGVSPSALRLTVPQAPQPTPTEQISRQLQALDQALATIKQRYPDLDEARQFYLAASLSGIRLPSAYLGQPAVQNNVTQRDIERALRDIDDAYDDLVNMRLQPDAYKRLVETIANDLYQKGAQQAAENIIARANALAGQKIPWFDPQSNEMIEIEVPIIEKPWVQSPQSGWTQSPLIRGFLGLPGGQTPEGFTAQSPVPVQPVQPEPQPAMQIQPALSTKRTFTLSEALAEFQKSIEASKAKTKKPTRSYGYEYPRQKIMEFLKRKGYQR